MRVLGVGLCAVLLGGCATLSGAARARQDEAARRLEALRGDPEALRSFLQAMPKGGDLHNHLSGAVSTESLIRWGAEDGLCLDPDTLTATEPPCGPKAPPLSSIAPGTEPYRALVAAWSMEGAQGSVVERHQHFFQAFRKFDLVTKNDKRVPDMLVEVTRLAARNHVGYLELMLGFGAGRVGKMAMQLMPAGGPWDEPTLVQARAALVANPAFTTALQESARNLDNSVARARSALGCDTDHPEPACRVELRFLLQASRSQPREYVFGQLVFGHELAQVSPRVVGLNLVQPEESEGSLKSYDDEMEAVDVLRRVDAGLGSRAPVHISLHAGELISDVLPATPQGQRHLTFHIRHAVELGHAERIGHGVDVLFETEGSGAEALLEEMRQRGVLVEICLSSNAALLGVSGPAHPLRAYLTHHVPVALATDDQGVLRSDFTGELVRAVQAQGLGYETLKAMVRDSLEHSFLPGPSLWRSTAPYAAAEACASEQPGNARPSEPCQRYLSASERAARQWQLEADLAAFEATEAPGAPAARAAPGR